MGCLRLVGSLKLQVSFAKETSKRDDVLQKRPIILRSLLIEATQYLSDAPQTPLQSRVIYSYTSITCVYIHCSTLQHTATHCNTLQHTATRCNTLQHAATHCNTLEHTLDTRTNTHTHTPSHTTWIEWSIEGYIFIFA